MPWTLLHDAFSCLEFDICGDEEMICTKDIKGSIPNSVKSRVVVVRLHRIQIRALCCIILQCAASLCLRDTILSSKTEIDSSNFDHTLAVPQKMLLMSNCWTPLKSLSPLKNLPGAPLKKTCSSLFVRDSSAIPDKQFSLAELP